MAVLDRNNVDLLLADALLINYELLLVLATAHGEYKCERLGCSYSVDGYNWFLYCSKWDDKNALNFTLRSLKIDWFTTSSSYLL